MKVARRLGRPKKEPPKSETDPFAVIGKIPKGLAYQWIAETILGEVNSFSRGEQKLKNSGWSQVPATRHPQMPKKGKYIYCGGLGLYQRSKKLNDAAKDEDIRRAKAQKEDQRSTVATANSNATNFASYDARIESGKKEFHEAHGLFDVVIKVKLAESHISSAVACGMSLSEYARAMVGMINSMGSGYSHALLPSVLENGVFEMSQLGFVNLSKEPVK